MLIDPFYDNVQFALFTSSKIIPWDKFNKNDQILKVIANSNTRQIPDAKVDLNMDDFEKHTVTVFVQCHNFIYRYKMISDEW